MNKSQKVSYLFNPPVNSVCAIAGGDNLPQPSISNKHSTTRDSKRSPLRDMFNTHSEEVRKITSLKRRATFLIHQFINFVPLLVVIISHNPLFATTTQQPRIHRDHL